MMRPPEPCSDCGAEVPRDELHEIPPPVGSRELRVVCRGCWRAYRRPAVEAALPRVLAEIGVPDRLRHARLPDLAPAVRSIVEAWSQTREALFAWGPVGVGKSHLAAAAIAWVVVEELLPSLAVRWLPVASLVDLLGDIRTGARALEELSRVSLLVIDDLGLERRTEYITERLDGLVVARHDARLRTIVTSNLSPSQLGQRSTRIASRLLSGSVVRLTGADRRFGGRRPGEAS